MLGSVFFVKLTQLDEVVKITVNNAIVNIQSYLFLSSLLRYNFCCALQSCTYV